LESTDAGDELGVLAVARLPTFYRKREQTFRE
jgi:hypothetical protein